MKTVRRPSLFRPVALALAAAGLLAAPARTGAVPGADAAPLGARAQGASAGQRRRQDVGLHARQERRQAEAAAVLRRRARQRHRRHLERAHRLARHGHHLDRAAGRHPAVDRRVRPALPVQQRARGRPGARRQGRRLLHGQADGRRPRQPGLVGERLSQHHELEAGDRPARRLRRREDARDAEPDLHRHLQGARHRTPCRWPSPRSTRRSRPRPSTARRTRSPTSRTRSSTKCRST